MVTLIILENNLGVPGLQECQFEAYSGMYAPQIEMFKEMYK